MNVRVGRYTHSLTMKCLVLLFVTTIGLVTGAPNTVKAAIVETQSVPKLAVGAGGVSASWGGYSASAGLGGEAVGSTKGGLFAAADSPYGKAAAGLGGSVGESVQGGLFAGAKYSQGNAAIADVGGYVDKSVRGGVAAEVPQSNVAIPKVSVVTGDAVKGGSDTTVNSGSSVGLSSSAGAGLGGGIYVTKGIHTTKVVQTQPGFFDRVFNIPISVLQAVNTHLNNRGPSKRVYLHGGAVVSGTSGHIPPATNTGGEATGGAGHEDIAAVQSAGSKDVYNSAHYGVAKAGGGLKVVTYETKQDLSPHVAVASSDNRAVIVQKPVRNYDHIFNIPISALKSVNQLLNG